MNFCDFILSNNFKKNSIAVREKLEKDTVFVDDTTTKQIYLLTYKSDIYIPVYSKSLWSHFTVP